MSVADIVPVALGLPSGDFITLWAPAWREDGEDWEAMLGLDEDLYGFATPAQLAAFLRSGAANDLQDHPSWEHTAHLPVLELDPDEEHSYDLVGVPESLSENPTEESVLELDDCFTMARTIGSICDIPEIEKFFRKHGDLGATSGGIDNFYGREGSREWTRIGKIISKHWDDVLNLIDELVTTPAVDASLVAAAEAELEEARALAAEREDADTAAGLLGDDDWEPDDDEDPFWASIGIDPVKIILPTGTRFTLRCYINDKPLFLGNDDHIFGFTSQRGMLRFLSEEPDHSMYKLPGWDQVVFQAGSGELNVRPTDDNIYSFVRLPKQIKNGPIDVDKNQLDLAVELLLDAEEYLDTNVVDPALDSSTRLGSYVESILDDDTDTDTPSEPYDDVVEEWDKLVDWLNGIVEKH